MSVKCDSRVIGRLLVFAFVVFLSAPQAYAQTSFPELTSSEARPQQGSLLVDTLRGVGGASQESSGEESLNPGFSLPLQAGEGMVMEEKTLEELEMEIREDAFNATKLGMFPLKPREIRRFLEIFDETQQAAKVPVHPYPKPEVSFTTISLDPGQAPLDVKLAAGHVTTINILDVTGQPWPIKDISWAGDFEVVDSGQGESVLRITPLSEYAYGNISIRLVELKTPIILGLKSGRTSVQYRLDVRVPEYGPFAQMPLLEGGISAVAGDSQTTLILDGAPPGAAEKLKVTGVDGRTTAYKLDGQTYVRTPLTLLSPGWHSSVRSADGMNVYTLGNTPVLLLSENGRMVRAHISREEPLE